MESNWSLWVLIGHYSLSLILMGPFLFLWVLIRACGI